jgi:hypothetical protein
VPPDVSNGMAVVSIVAWVLVVAVTLALLLVR